MKFLLILLCSVLSTTAFAQQTINDPNAKARKLNAAFTAIDITDGIELFLSQGTEESIAVSTSDEKYEDRFKTEVEDGVLKIYFDNKGINWSDNNRRKLKAYVSFQTLSNLTAAGGADVKVASGMNVNSIAMKFTSGSTFNGKITGKEITVDQSSGSMMNITGTADKIVVEVSSGAILKGYDFAAEYCEAKASSGGAIRISVQKELSASANTGGGIHYKGTAVIKDIDISSGGVVKKA